MWVLFALLTVLSSPAWHWTTQPAMLNELTATFRSRPLKDDRNISSSRWLSLEFRVEVLFRHNFLLSVFLENNAADRLTSCCLVCSALL